MNFTLPSYDRSSDYTRDLLPCQFAVVNKKVVGNIIEYIVILGTKSTKMRSNLLVQSHFTYVPSPDPSVKTLLANCIRCKKYSRAKNTTRQQEHLLECTGFAEWKKANQSKSKNNEQQTLTTMLSPRLDPVRKARIDQKFANAIFESGSPFSLFEHPAFKEAFAEFGYTPPNRKTIG